MSVQSVFRFLRPTLAVISIFALALLVGRIIGRVEVSGPANLQQVSQVVRSLEHPRADLSPADVVRIQLQGLASPDQAQGILQCLNFASPDNLAMTGPVERFGRIVRSPPYLVLAAPEQVLVGKPVQLDEKARVLVTVLKNRQLSSFVWILSQQSEGPHAHCWLTDGVIPVDPESMPQ